MTIYAQDPNYALASGEDDRLRPDSEGRKRVIAASYFGQSSFSSLALVKETSLICVNDLLSDPHDLARFAPLGMFQRPCLLGVID